MSRRTQVEVNRKHEPDRLSQVWLETAYEQLVPRYIRVVRQMQERSPAKTEIDNLELEGGQWDEHDESSIVRPSIKRAAG